MKCSTCGSESAAGSPFCSTCGSNLAPGVMPRSGSPIATRTSGMAIAGFVCSFFCGLVGLILSIIGYRECKRSNGTIKGQGLALAGIIISSLLGIVGILAAVAIPAFLDYMHKSGSGSKSSEARVQLSKLEREFKTYYAVNATLPKGSAPLTPATDCCDDNYAGKRKCAPHPEAWSTPEWQALDFEIYEPHYFRYGYESDGDTFRVTAVGDLDCDGDKITYELTGRAVNGELSVTRTDPLPNSD